jgi:hypothetical protein
MNKISEAIKCVNCRNVLESPVSLPCGCSICLKHTRDVKVSILCCSCEIDHPLPSNGNFPPNKVAIKMLEAQINTLEFGKEQKEAKQSCDRLEKLLNNIDSMLKDPFNFIYEAVEFLKNAAQLKVDEMKLKLDEDLALLISQLDDFKIKCKTNLKSFEYLDKSSEFEKAIESGNKELEKWFVTLNELKQNEPEWKRIQSESEMRIKYFQRELKTFKFESLFQKRYNEYRNEVEEKFGKFEIDSNFNFGRLLKRKYF